MSEAIIPKDPQTVALLRLDRAALPQYLTRDQVKVLIAACRDYRHGRDRMFIRVAYETGGRVSELIEIRRCDIDLTNRQIRLRTLKRRTDRRKKKILMARWIPISADLCADLGNYFLKMREHQELVSDDYIPESEETLRVFPISRQAAHKLIKKAGKRAGLVARGGREVSPHILRHSFAMNCLTHGVPINILKDLLGHASISSTMVYLKTDPAEAREFLSKVQF